MIGAALLRDTLAMVLAGGQGERLYPLTKDRSKPSVPFGGLYRIVDFTLQVGEGRETARAEATGLRKATPA